MAQRNNVGAFIPTTNIWDVSEIYSTEVTSPAFKELLVRLYQNLNNMALSTNIKDSAMYPLDEFVTGGQYFPNPAMNSGTQSNPVLRPVARMTVNFGPLPNNATIAQPHNIPVNSMYTFTRMYGAGSDTTGLHYIPLPNASNMANETIQLYADATNVYVQTIGNFSNYNVAYIILEYIKT